MRTRTLIEIVNSWLMSVAIFVLLMAMPPMLVRTHYLEALALGAVGGIVIGVIGRLLRRANTE